MSFKQFIGKFERVFRSPLQKSALNGVGKIIIQRLRETTDKGKGIDQGKVKKLAPLAPSTKKRKRKLGLPTRPRLRETGKMMKSLFARTNLRKQQVTVKVKPSQQKKVEFAHDGGPGRPPRPWLPPGKQELDRITKNQILDFLEKRLDRRFKKL